MLRWILLYWFFPIKLIKVGLGKWERTQCLLDYLIHYCSLILTIVIITYLCSIPDFYGYNHLFFEFFLKFELMICCHNLDRWVLQGTMWVLLLKCGLVHTTERYMKRCHQWLMHFMNARRRQAQDICLLSLLNFLTVLKL